MNTTVRPQGRFGNRQGIAAGVVALLSIVLLGMCALAVDLGMLLAGRTEAQRAADAGALSGALSLYEVPGNEDLARDKAIEIAAANRVRGSSTDVLTGDVEVDGPNGLVRVKVMRSAGRGSALSNLFARVLGISTSNVGAIAAAQMSAARGIECPFPFAIVDRWWEPGAGRLANSTDTWQTGTDVYNEGPIEALPGSATDPTGYGVPDRGSLLRIYPPDPSGSPLPGWAYLLELEDTGGDVVRDWITGCENPNHAFNYGDPIEIKNGLTTGPVSQGIEDMIAMDAGAFWGTGTNAPPGGCVFRPGVVDSSGNYLCVSSPRTRAGILISPEEVPTSPGNTTVDLQNFVGLFVICAGVLNHTEDGCTGNINSTNAGVHVRFIDYRGVNSLGPATNGGSLVRVLQLVQ